MKAIASAAADTDRVVKGAAQMVGAEVKIETCAGYQSLKQSYPLGEIFKETALEFMNDENTFSGIDSTGSSDIGDLSQLIPTIEAGVGGFNGQLHSKEFSVADEETAYVLSAKIMALTAYRLLCDGARLGKEIKKSFVPTMSKEEYISALEAVEND